MLSEKSNIIIIDTSAIFSGKQLNFENKKIITIENLKKEIKAGGKDYRNFQYLIEKGLIFYKPSKESKEYIDEISKKTGDYGRLSEIDKEILALALDIKKQDEEPVILTDDYSIQNMAEELKIKYENISQKGITKKYKWICKCKGCGKKYKDNINICLICGSETKKIIIKDKNI